MEHLSSGTDRLRCACAALLFSLCGIGCASGPAPTPAPTAEPSADPRTVKHVKVYAGDNGLKVTVVHFMPPHGDEVLLEVTGTESELDSIVLPHKVETGPQRYETTVHGRPYWTMRHHARHDRWEVWVSGRANRVTYDEAATAAAVGDEVLARFGEQEKAGILHELQRFNRDERIANHKKDLARRIEQVREACGFTVTATVDWESVSDEDPR